MQSSFAPVLLGRQKGQIKYGFNLNKKSWLKTQPLSGIKTCCTRHAFKSILLGLNYPSKNTCNKMAQIRKQKSTLKRFYL